MTAPNHRWRKSKNALMQVTACACALLVVLPLVLVVSYVVARGFHYLNWAFFTQTTPVPMESGGGMANAIVGTLILLVLSPIVGVPAGVLGGVYLSEYGGSRLNWWIRFGADILNGVPSIVWGLVVYGLMVVAFVAPFRGTVRSVDTTKHLVTVQNPAGVNQTFGVEAKTRLNLDGRHQIGALQPGNKIVVWYHEIQGTSRADNISSVSVWNFFPTTIVQIFVRLHNSVAGFSALAGGVVLGFMMIPLVMRTTEEVLQLVPQGYREAALALGIPKWRTALQIVVRTALKGITTGSLLALARIGGETAPLLFTVLGNQNLPHSLLDKISAIPLQIYQNAITPYPNLKHLAWAGALVLLLFVLFINIGVRFLTRDRFQKQS